MASRRTVDNCPYRFDVQQRADAEVARCRLVPQITGAKRTVPFTRRGTCEICCQLAEPNGQVMNCVIASLVCETTCRVIAEGGVAGCDTANATRIQRRAMCELEIVPDGADDTEMSRCDSAIDTPQALIDRSITVDTLTDHLARNEPFTYARYGDGEWLSMLGTRGRNCDDHMFFPCTMGRELCRSFDELLRLSRTKAHVYVGLHAQWHQGDIQDYLRTHHLTDHRCFVDCRLLQWGLRDLSTKRLLEAIRDFAGDKILVANRQLRPVAKGLRCRHVPIPKSDCYLKIDRAEKACRFRGPGLVLLCASMATECLIGRLRKSNPSATFIDCGHIFDAMVLGPTRWYTRRDAGGISSDLRTHYAPMFLDQGSTWARRLFQRLGRGK